MDLFQDQGAQEKNEEWDQFGKTRSLSLYLSPGWCLAEAGLHRVRGPKEPGVRPEKSSSGSPSFRDTMLWHREDFLLEVQVATSPAPPSPPFVYQSESKREMGQEANFLLLAASMCL